MIEGYYKTTVNARTVNEILEGEDYDQNIKDIEIYNLIELLKAIYKGGYIKYELVSGPFSKGNLEREDLDEQQIFEVIMNNNFCKAADKLPVKGNTQEKISSILKGLKVFLSEEAIENILDTPLDHVHSHENGFQRLLVKAMGNNTEYIDSLCAKTFVEQIFISFDNISPEERTVERSILI